MQQAPLLDTTLELPSPSAQHVTFSSHFPSRNHLGHDFPVQSEANSRLPPPVHGGGPIDYRYNSSSERRLPGGPSHDPSHSRHSGIPTGIPMDGGRRPPAVSSSEHRESSTSNNVASTSKPRKEISTVVIACRQWYVLPSLCSFIKPFNGILTDFGLRHPACLSIAVVEKSVATLRDPYVPIAPDDPTYASTMLFQNEGVPISVPALVSDHVKSGLQTDLFPLLRNVKEQLETVLLTHEKLHHLLSKRICLARSAPQRLLVHTTYTHKAQPQSCRHRRRN